MAFSKISLHKSESSGRRPQFLEVMEFIHFEALDEDENIDFNVEGKVSDDDLSSFIDDSEKNENVCDYYRFDNVTRSAESALKNVLELKYYSLML